MPKKSWNVQLENGPCTVEFERNLVAKTWSICVDGRTIQEGSLLPAKLREDYPFQIRDHSCIVHYRTTRFGYDLSIDGRSLWTGLAVQQLLPLPSWTWIYIIACLAIPVFTAMSLAPILMGISGAGMCYRVARTPAYTVIVRIAGCVVICVGCWLLVLVMPNSMLGHLTR